MTTTTLPPDDALPDTAASESASARADFPVVGIGASAGGIEALTTLFRGLPAQPEMAFVVVLHLSPDHESSLAAILAQSTPMPVLQVQETTPIARDHVYVISPRLELRMDDDHLLVAPLERGRGPNTAIDLFLRTLGDARRERSVGVVLSGMGSDGALGLRRIKEQGGVTLAQAPHDAQFDSMPASAIAEGVVDFVLPVADMGARLIDLWRNARVIELPAETDVALRVSHPETPVTVAQADQAMLEIMSLLRDRTGHDFTHYKTATVLRRLERRLQVTGMRDLPAYSRHLQNHFEETAALLRDLLISITNFFRDREAFDSLGQAMAGMAFQGQPGHPRMRAWIAGCASGEEAFSVAMLLSEIAVKRSPAPELQVFASDIDDRAIAFARASLYPEAIAADVSTERLRQYFQREQSHLRVRKELREKVLFATHNLLRDPPFSNVDLVCCRNLLIYLDRYAQNHVLQVLHFALRPGGLLFLGGAESIDLAQGLFTVVDKRHRIYRAEKAATSRRAVVPVVPWSARPATAPLVEPAPAPSFPSPLSPPPAAPGTPAALHEQLRQAHSAASVLVDGAYNVLHSTPQTDVYLRFAAGTPSQNLLDVIRPELATALRTALFKAWNDRKSVEARQVRLRSGTWITMTMRPLENNGVAYMLVVFGEVQENLMAVAGRRSAKDSALLVVEEELRRTHAELLGIRGESAQSTEELRASNEELQSINEELRSATEELETSKEELQSLNEELLTVNHELKIKVEEAAMVNDDLTNLIGSTEIATIFVDRAMRIKRFTPRASELFNLLPSDVGRSLLHITHSLAYDCLEADALEAFDSLRLVEREVRGRDGTYLVRVLPYRTRQDLIDGAVLTFVDISATRRAEERVRAGEANLRLLVESTKDFAIMTLDDAGLITSWNEGAQRMFGFGASDIIGEPIDVIFTPDDRDAGAPQREMQLARDDGRASDERWHLRKDGKSFYCSGIMTPLFDHGQLVGYAKIARDLTDSKRAEIRLGTLLEKETEVRAELQRAVQMKDEFLAVMSHELKHPLNLIHVNAELLARLPETRNVPAVTRAAEVIRRAVLSQAKITDDLLDLSRLRTGKLTINVAPVLLSMVVGRVADAVAEEAKAKGLAVTFDHGPTNLMVAADPVRIEQIVWNLVSNALKFTPSGGTIEIRIAMDDDSGRLDVIDTGQGIGADFIGEVFDMFRQADRSTTRAHGGMGIGLALVKQLAEEQGGRVAVHSEGAGRGARFSVWLPMAGAEGAAPVPDAPPAAMQGLKILLVDDTPDALESLSALLGLEGANVMAVGSAQDALKAAEEGGFDLLLSDVAMPEMDGYELVARLRSNATTSSIRAVALTGFGRPQDAQRALESGFDAHLAKPVGMERLLEVMRGLDSGRETAPGRNIPAK